MTTTQLTTFKPNDRVSLSDSFDHAEVADHGTVVAVGPAVGRRGVRLYEVRLESAPGVTVLCHPCELRLAK